MSKLSDEKIDEIAKAYKATLLGGNPYFPWFDYAKAIEDAVLEAQGKQEPVAWMVVTADDKLVFINANQAEHYAKQWELEVCPLFATPVVQEKQEPWPFSADRVTYHKAAPVVQPNARDNHPVD